jgi:16S rRNA C1402 N4-methylase RsmH
MAWMVFSQPLRLVPYRSTLELAEVICSVKGSDDRGFHPAKQAFQAMRRFLNQDTSDTQWQNEISFRKDKE